MTRTILTAAAAILLAAAPSVAGTVSGTADCNGNCADLVVYLEGAPSQVAEDVTAVFDQRDKVFIPHVLPVLQGTTVNITNGDPFLHNVHVYQGKDTVLNLALPFQGQVMPHAFADAGTYAVRCDAHPEMSAFIVVLENPYFTRAGEDGSYEIADVPAGEYTLVVRDVEKDKTARSTVTVN